MKKIITLLLVMTVVLTFVACGGQKDDSEGKISNKKEDSDSSVNDKSDDNYEFDIKEDDHTVIFTIANTIQVYTHDGVKVTGYTTYADCGDAETAKVVASAMNLEDDYYKNMGMKSVTTKGKYVVTEYTEEGFPCETYEELHNLAETYRSIQQ